MSKTTLRKGKQDDKFSLAIRDIQASQAANKKCFDCEQRGPTYINTTIGSFVCTKCSGMLRGINPPHRIKSISMSSFSADEVEMMRNRGNAWCAAVWLGLFDAHSQPVDYKDDEKIKEFIIAKYEKKRYYVDPSQARISRVSSASPAPEQLSATSSRSSLASGSLIGSTLKARMDPGSQVNISVSRPGVASRPTDQPTPPRPTSNGLPVTVAHQPVKQPVQMAPQAAPATAQTALPVQPARPVPQPVPQQPAPVPKTSESFGNFADFDSVAFDSMPAGKSAVPPNPAGVRVPPDLLEATPQPASQPVVCAAVSLTALTNSNRGPPPPRPPPPRDLPLPPSQKTLPRTNPYFASPKSPRSPEFGPFRQAELPHLPDVVHRPSHFSHSQSTYHLAAKDVSKPSTHHQSTTNLLSTSSTLPSKLSHSASHATLFKPESIPTSIPSPSKPTSPQSPDYGSISSKRLSSLPPRALPSNPFLWPLSSLPPDDPSDEARRLGTELFTDLLRCASRPPLNAQPSSPPSPPKSMQCDLLKISTNLTAAPSSTNRSVVPSESKSDVVCVSAVSTLSIADTKTNTVCLANTNSTMTTTKTVDANRAIPSDPLTTPNVPLGFGAPAAKGPAKPQEDKYSALAELDDLFKSTAIQEPVFSDPAPSFPEPQAPVPPTADLFQSLLETGGGGLTTGGGVFGAVERASNGSPAGSWGRSASPRRAPSSSNNMWGAGEGWDHPPASQAVQPNPGLGGGWDHAPTLAQGAQLVPQHATHSTNPFGTSPSNPTYHAPVVPNQWSLSQRRN